MIANKRQKTDQQEILVVDDTPANLQLLTGILTGHGYRVRPAADGRLAMQSVAARLPDLILLDVKMPDIDGYEVCRHIKANEQSRKIPVIFISALGDTAEKIEGFKAGGVDYITKPFEPEEVLARVGTHLRLWELTERLEQKVSLRTAELTTANKQLRREITQRKQAEEALRASEIKFREFVEGTDDLVTQVDGEGNFTYLNDVAEKILGLKPDDCIGLSGFSFIHPDDRFETQRNFQEWVSKRLSGITLENRQVSRNGEVHEMLWTINPHFDKDGNVITINSIARDITERKRTEEALHKSEEKYRNLIQQSNDAIYLLYNKNFEIINEKFQEIFGLSLEDVNKPDFNIMNLVAPKSREFIEEREKQFAKGQELEHTYEFTALSKDGKEIEVEVSTSHIKYKDGIATQGILHNITERKNLEQQLRQMLKMESIGTLTGGIAHDFNNLLTVINGHAEMTLMKCEKDHPLHKNIASIHQAGKKAANLTKQLLAFSRKQIIKPQTVDINILISDFDKMIRRLIGEDISMELNLFHDISLIKADPSQLEQILINLIVNARDAINQLTELASEKKITIETNHAYLDELYVSKHVGSQIGLHIIISVSDNGIGMDKEIKNKIFEPFFTTKEIGQGTGLGLATVYGIVKQNRGSIYVYSEQGQGTTIKIYWPSTEERKVPDLAKKTSKDNLTGNETILLVEDDKGVLDFAFSVLEELGYSVYRASNGKKALELAKEKNIRFDLLFTDLIMPEMNGKELATSIKKLDPEISIIYTSGYTDNHILHSGVLDEGINFIQKPYSVHTLAQKIREMLDKK